MAPTTSVPMAYHREGTKRLSIIVSLVGGLLAGGAVTGGVATKMANDRTVQERANEKPIVGGVTIDQLRVELNLALDPLRTELASVKAANAINASRIAAIDTALLPRVDRMDAKMGEIAENVARLVGRTEK